MMYGLPEPELDNMTELLHSIIGWAVQMLNVDTGEIYLYDPVSRLLKLDIATGSMQAHLGTVLRPGEGLAGRVLSTGQAMMVDDYRVWEGRADVFGTPLSCAELAVPLAWQARTIGVLILALDSQKRSFSPSDVHLAGLCGNLAAVAIENARLYHEVRGSMLKLKRTLEEEVADRTTELAMQAAQIERSTGSDPDASQKWSMDELLGRVMELKVAKKVLAQVESIHVDASPPVDLTPREVEILALVVKGRTNKEIAHELGLAVSTVKFHVGGILGRLKLPDRTQAAVWAVRRGIVKGDAPTDRPPSG